MSHPHGEHPVPAPDSLPPFVPQQPLAPPVEQLQTASMPMYQAGTATVPGPSPDASPDAPVSVAPYGYEAPIAPPKQGRTGKIVLSIATGVLALATVAFGVLYFFEASARASADKTVAEKTTALTAAQAKSKDLDRQLTAAKDDVARLNQDLTGAKNKTDEVAKERDAMAACFQAMAAYGAKQNAANAKQLIIKCDEAEKYY